MKSIHKIKAWYRLTEQKGIGNTLAHKIISDIGDPAEYIGVKSPLWDSIDYVSEDIKDFFQKDIDPPLWSRIADFLEHSPLFRFISFIDPDYPERLKTIYQPPL